MEHIAAGKLFVFWKNAEEESDKDTKENLLEEENMRLEQENDQ